MTKQDIEKQVPSESAVLREHQRVLTDLARYAAETFGLKTFLDDTVVRVSAAVEIDHVKILRYRPELGDLVVESGVGWNPGFLKASSFATDLASPPGCAFQTGQPIFIADLYNSEDFRVSRPLQEHGIVSILNVPIFSDAAPWGVLEIDSTVLREFSEDTTKFLVACAALISLAVRKTDAELAQANALADRAQEAQKKEIFLREMQHRVKNNFQMLLAMMSLHKPKFPTKEGRELVSMFSDAIRAISLAHDQLSSTQAGQVVRLSPYLKALVGGIKVSLENIAIEVRSDELDVSIEQAVPIGLIVNELITNSVKHAFNDHGGAIQIELIAGSGPGISTLSVSDNGKGIDKAQPAGSGLKLVRALADQIRARLEQDNLNPGMITRLMFPTRVHEHA